MESKWSLPPTAPQTTAIARLCIASGIREPLEDTISTRWEARRMIYDLRNKLGGRNV